MKMKMIRSSSGIFFFIMLMNIFQTSWADEATIREACSVTPYPDVCATSLKSNPSSGSADVVGLTKIAIQVTQGSATDFYPYIRLLLSQSTDPGTRDRLNYCLDDYSAITGGLETALVNFDKKDYKEAESGLQYCTEEIHSCKAFFKDRKSPIEEKEDYLDKLCGNGILLLQHLYQ